MIIFISLIVKLKSFKFGLKKKNLNKNQFIKNYKVSLTQ